MYEPKAGPLCSECPLFSTGIPAVDRRPVDPRTWNRLTIISDMPGKSEMEGGLPFSGPPGRLLWAIISTLGYAMEDVHATHCIKCGQRGGKKLTEKRLRRAAECCRPVLASNLLENRTKVALCVGAVSWKAMSGLTGIDTYRGTILLPDDQEEPWIAIPTLHPAGIIHTPPRHILVELMGSDIKKAFGLADGSVTPWESPVRDAMDIDDLLYWIKAVRNLKEPVAVDVETDGIDALTCNLLTVGISAIQPTFRAYSIPWKPAYPHSYTESEWKEVKNALLGLLNDPQVPLVFQNKSYDVPVLHRTTGSELSGVWHDTLLMHHAIYPKLPHTLQSIGAQFLAVESWKSDFESSTDKAFKTMNAEDDEELVIETQNKILSELLWYNATDAAVTIEVFHKLNEELDQIDVRGVYEKDCELLDCAIDWYYNGIGVDLDVRAELAVEYSAQIEEYLSELRELCALPSNTEFVDDIEAAGKEVLAVRAVRNANRRTIRKLIKLDSLSAEGRSIKLAILDDLNSKLEEQEVQVKSAELLLKTLRKQPCQETFNPNSPDQLRTAIIEGRGMTPTKVTKKTAQPSTSKDALWDMRDDEFVGLLFQYKTIHKLHSTYIKNLEKHLHSDGRIHPIWKLHSTPSGRFGTKPAVQNWPKSMRKMLIPAEGNKIVGADYSALELRIQALFAGQEDLIAAFNDNIDIHKRHATWFFGKVFDDADDEIKSALRGRGKNVTFGKIYGAGPDTLYDQIREKRPDVKTKKEQHQLKIEVRNMAAVLDKKYPNQRLWSDWAISQAKEYNSVKTPRSRRIRKWPMGEITPTEPPNHLIQGSGADIMNEATLQLVAALKERGWYQTRVWIILQIHDALYLEVEEEIAEEVAKLLEECMYTEWTYTSPVTGISNTMKFPAEAAIGNRVSEV